jgi:hypothetical protein
MRVLALLKVASPDAESVALAADLGITPYEAGQLVRGHLPSIVLKTADVTKVEHLLAKLRARGNEAIACDASTVAEASAMHEFRGFRFEADALVSLNQNGTSERLPWEDVTTIIRATLRVADVSVETTRERKFDLGRAVLTQGLSVSKTVTKQSVQEIEKREPVIYLFRRSGPPWTTGESRARYDGLGADLKPGRLENFNVLVKKLRERLPQVPYDERLVHVRSGSVELLAHLVSLSLRSGERVGVRG